MFKCPTASPDGRPEQPDSHAAAGAAVRPVRAPPTAQPADGPSSGPAASRPARLDPPEPPGGAWTYTRASPGGSGSVRLHHKATDRRQIPTRIVVSPEAHTYSAPS